VASGTSSELAGTEVVRRAYFGDLPRPEDLNAEDMNTEDMEEVIR